MFIDSIYSIMGHGNSNVYFNAQYVGAKDATLELDAEGVFLKNFYIDFEQTVGNILTSSSRSVGTFSTPFIGSAYTGMFKPIIGNVARDGFILLDDKTIGNSSSGATNTASSAMEDLFVHCWETYDNTTCPVSGGRGSTASADWEANKTIKLPPYCGRVVGNWGSGSGLTVKAFGSIEGEETHLITLGELGPHQHYYPYWDTSGVLDTTSQSKYGTHGFIQINVSTTPDGSVTTSSNTSTHTARNNMEATTFFTWMIKT